MIDVKIIKKPKSGRAAIGGGIATAANSYTNDSQQTLADVLNFNAAVSRLLQPYDANNQPLAWAQATDPDGDGGIKAKTLRASVTFASVGDVVAYQNGNLSGGTGGGGLDITALEDYLTTNGYATQAWVSAHFNDYVLTKAAVEAVLTGNITSHTHSQYLTQHQSLANYYTKAESDGKYLLSSAYTAADILTKIKTVDGAGSGLDADMLDGYQALDFLRNRYRVSTADVYMDVNEVPANSVQHDYRWDNVPTRYSGSIASVLDLTYSPDWRTQLFVWHTAKTNILVRSRHSGTTWGDWRELAFTDSNVASATKLQTARTINGTAFDGTAAITTAKWGTARNLTIGNTAKSVDGSSAVAWSLAEIGALGVNANAVSASKLQTARTIWGQSFNGTANVSGSLSGVGDINMTGTIYNTRYLRHAGIPTDIGTLGSAIGIGPSPDNYGLFLWGRSNGKGYMQVGRKDGIQTAYDLILQNFGGNVGIGTETPSAKLDVNGLVKATQGIYSKGDIATDGTIKIGGGTITWDAGNNAFMFSHTVASQGDMVAFQNGNLSGGTGGGGLDITALESYLTTNGYATQDWVAAHFNDYVLTKAAVEAVLTGNITTHTHNQYLTEHQSLANYYTKTEADGKYLTAITKSMVEAVLTGNITSHTHSQYLTEHQSLANYMTRGEIGDTYQTKNAALSFTAAIGYVAARFTDAALATAAAQNYIELWGTDGWFNLQTGYLLAHGAVTASQFIKTGGTASQFLKADGSVDANTYLTTGDASDTYLPKATYTASDILTKIKTVDGAGSGLDADMLDGVHGKGYMYYNAYNFSNGCLVRLKLEHNNNYMVTVHIRGNSFHAYHDRPIDTLVQFYHFKSEDAITKECVLHNGYDFGNINVFCYDGHVYLWFKQTVSYQSFSVYAECTNVSYVGNLVEDITNAAMPTEGVTRLKTIVPKKSALITDNVASATKLQTARAIWGQSFDGTANVSGSLSGVEDITFNANAKIAATANHLRLLTKSGGPQGLAAAQLLASDLYADWSKVPANGIYSKGDIATGGVIKIGGGTITWDEATNSFIFSHTVASQGDVVAFKQ